ncbi:MAG: regulatory protein RecX [Solirubrobacterales bacterium]
MGATAESRGVDKAVASLSRSLSRRERGSTEARRWLEDREYPPEVAEVAVERLISVGALDDERFAAAFVHDKRELAGWGAERIRAGLEARGVDSAVIEQALAGYGHQAELERAVTLLENRRRPLEDSTDRDKALGFLVRRGFGLELAYDAVRSCARG